ncbi:MAG: phosphopantetheine-binding protein [Smithellaceae bacterium]|jgi:acyl carrier protein|nr:phosphopantetheine-binding protein [Smithellaceae bacterium]MDD3258699.1 phosphopantetheine-binding protein [Smithellaceae bacterium]MDD3848683.1 phosphopantetheine-binding protein [Smithellaceae bacterium]HOG11545.1 phosphopantetheine-binding protein [Smithellaceae bacterium]HOQ71534.1 phosphopantetheine-binding protein [Smithellaceae bacterium]
MTRQEIEKEIRAVLLREFEVENPEPDVNLREAYGFDSIDAIELLLEIERFLGTELTQAEKKKAMDIRTLNQIIDYVEMLAHHRKNEAEKA